MREAFVKGPSANVTGARGPASVWHSSHEWEVSTIIEFLHDLSYYLRADWMLAKFLLGVLHRSRDLVYPLRRLYVWSFGAALKRMVRLRRVASSMLTADDHCYLVDEPEFRNECAGSAVSRFQELYSDDSIRTRWVGFFERRS